MVLIKCIMVCCTQILIPDKIFTKQDQATLDRARFVCREQYKNSPCLVKLKRVEDSVYSAICGKNNN